VAGGATTGDKQFTVSCPFKAGSQTVRMSAISGGFDIQGSITASYRSNASGAATTGVQTVGDSWTVKQTSGAALSGTIYVLCV
jgi:hypothetical protein